jgi:hypothetical protein
VKTSTFTLVFVLMFLLLSIHYNHLTKNDNDAYRGYIQKFLKSNPQVLILGDSHPFNAICTSELDDRYFNLSWGSDDIRQMFLKLDFAIKNKPDIRYVAVPLDYHTFAEYRYINNSFARDLYYTSNLGLVTELFNSNTLVCYNELLAKRCPLISAKNWEKYFLILLTKCEGNGISKEASCNWVEIDEDKKLYDTKCRVNGQLSGRIVVDKMVDVFDKLISYCDKLNINIIGIKYPLSRQYIEVSKGKDLDRVEQVISQREDRFISILDYRDLFIDHPQYFCNTDHLSPVGAKIFTQVLKRDIEDVLQ